MIPSDGSIGSKSAPELMLPPSCFKAATGFLCSSGHCAFLGCNKNGLERNNGSSRDLWIKRVYLKSGLGEKSSLS